MKQPNGYWSYNRVREEALKYKSKGAFKKGSSSAYQIAVRGGYMDTFTHFTGVLRHWDSHAILEAAKTCKTAKEFVSTHGGAYIAALRLGLQAELVTIFKGRRKNLWEAPTYLYCYLHPEGYAYVGITHDVIERHERHKDNPWNEEVCWLADQLVPEPFQRYDPDVGTLVPHAMSRKTAERFERFAIQRLISLGHLVVNKVLNPQYSRKRGEYTWPAPAVA
jgi:hypothetical protein